MSEQQTEIDLSPFCDPSAGSRYGLDEPWTADGWTYATNGKILVRVLATGEPDSPPRSDGRRRPGKPHEIVPPVDGDWQPWPEVPACSACEGTQKINCPECFGDGQCEKCKCGNSHECGNCDGTGQSDCDVCLNLGGFKTLFGDAELALHFAGLVSRLPNAMFLPAVGSAAVVRFKFDGGEGDVMPLQTNR